VNGQRWVTQFEQSIDDFSHVDSFTLATVQANTPDRVFFPYVGDYAHLLAVDKDFYGVFSTSNFPDMANFPNGVTYQRKANFATHTLLDLNNGPVSVSIDPFFFKVAEVP